MKKNLLPGIGATVLVLMTLTACGGATASPESGSTPAGKTATATPTPAKQYTNEELAALVEQVKESDGTNRAVVSGPELVAQFEPVRVLTKASIEPAGCADLGTLGAYQAIDGSTSAGTTRSKTGDFITSLAVTSGVDTGVLQANLDKSKSQIEACKKVTLSAEGDTMTLTTEKIDGVGNVPGTVGLKTIMVMPDGKAGAIYSAHAIKGGVLISASASSNNAASGGPEAAGALMDQAAALIK